MALIYAPGAADGLTGRRILPSASHQTVVILYVTLAFKNAQRGIGKVNNLLLLK